MSLHLKRDISGITLVAEGEIRGRVGEGNFLRDRQYEYLVDTELWLFGTANEELQLFRIANKELLLFGIANEELWLFRTVNEELWLFR